MRIFSKYLKELCIAYGFPKRGNRLFNVSIGLNMPSLNLPNGEISICYFSLYLLYIYLWFFSFNFIYNHFLYKPQLRL